MFILKKFKNIIAAAVCIAMLAGCSGGGDVPADTSGSAAATAPTADMTVSTGPTSPEASDEAPVSAAALASENEPSTRKGERPLTIAVRSVNGSYSPFDEEDECTGLLNKMTGVTLIGRTRSGAPVMSGTTAKVEQYGGNTYSYSGIADISVSYSSAADETTYDIALRSDVRFADGETLDADDVIFTMYLHLDPSYAGSFALHDAGIIGAFSYRYDSDSADNVTRSRIDEALASPGMLPILKEKIMLPTLKAQYENIKTFYGDSTYSFYTSKYPTPQELFAFFYSIDGSYSAKGKTESEVISDVADMYGNDYRQLASITLGDDTVFDEQVLSLAIGYITSGSDTEERADRVDSVSGIVKNGQFSLSVTVKGDGSQLEEQLRRMPIVPLHYYGNEQLYKPENGTYGFAKGTADEIVASHRQDPLGAGAFRVTGFEDGAVLLTANSSYYKGAVGAPSAKLIASGSEQPAALIADGTADICADSVTAESFTAVDEANKSIEKIYPAISRVLGYGYIGINADTVRIGDQFSAKSYALRKGIATAVAGFRGESLQSYFGGYDVAADYPYIENITADNTAAGYTVPFTVDVNGNAIFTAGMTDEERYTALKTACLGFFREAGYTISDGKVTGAPTGGKLTYNAAVAGGGVGDHPSYTAIKKASELLADIGITLTVTDITDPSVLWESLNNDTNEIWAGVWNHETLREAYIDSIYGLEGSTKLKRFIADAEAAAPEDKPAAFLICYKKIVDEYAVEIPMYVRTDCTLFSALRVDTSTITADMTDTYDWTDEIASIKIK